MASWRYMAIGVLGLAVGLSQTNTLSASELDDCRIAFTNDVQRIQDAYRKRLEALNDAYLHALNALVKTLKQAGDPDPVLAVQHEKYRFTKEYTVPDPPPDTSVTALHNLQQQYLDAARRARLAKFNTYLARSARYVAELEALMHTYTKTDRLDLALAAKREIRLVEEKRKRVAKVRERLVKTLRPPGSEATAAPSPIPDPDAQREKLERLRRRFGGLKKKQLY